MKRGPSKMLEDLEREKSRYGQDAARRKRDLLVLLEKVTLYRRREVERLHDVLCFLRAYPDDAKILASVERALDGFDRRRDLKRYRKSLAGSGIAGTRTPYRFYAPTASWLARRWGDRLRIDWKEMGDASKLESLLHLLALYAETPGLDLLPFTAREWIDKMRGPEETDAAFLLRRFAALRVDPFAREAIYDDLDPSLILEPGPHTPSRTRARFSGAVVHYQTAPLRRSRPGLAKEIAQPPRSVKLADRAASRELIDLARGMMVAMSRDLDVFSYASEEDVRIADCGEGLLFAFLGFVPERRLMLETLYGYLILKNGVPIGYGSVACLYGSAEVAFNVSGTFRGGQAGFVFARLLACTRAIFGSDTFCLDPYQLGEDNPEALKSGAWWFYQKLGFRARDRSVLRLMREELALMKKDPAHRSGIETLRKLASAYVFLHVGERREDVLGILPLENVGLAVTRHLAERFGSDRERAARACSREVAKMLGVRSLRAFSPGERLAWERFSPLLRILPGIERWSARDRRALIEVVRAKGAKRESLFAARLDAHRRLRRAIRDVATENADLSAKPAPPLRPSRRATGSRPGEPW